ncbi:MAG TPA: hypothetical protein VES66_10515 [Terriglobales bacterium]|nr:hypothetical protein [Terriglobales bacterium]
MSAIPAGMAMIIMALYLSVRSLNVRIDMRILDDFSRIIAPMLAIFTLFRFADLSKQHALGYLFLPVEETAYFWLEMALFIAAPLVMFNLRRVRMRPIGLYWASAVTIAGFMVHRINVSITSLERATHAGYVPKWTEMAVTIMLVTAAVLAFRWAVLHLKILPQTLEVSPPPFQLPRMTGYVFPAHPSTAVN